MVLQGQVIRFNSDSFCRSRQLLHCDEKIILVPIGIHQIVVSKSLAPGLTAVDVGTDRGQALLGYDAPIISSKGGVHKICEIINTMHRSKNSRLNIQSCHLCPQRGATASHFIIAESGLGRCTIFQCERVRPFTCLACHGKILSQSKLSKNSMFLLLH